MTLEELKIQLTKDWVDLDKLLIDLKDLDSIQQIDVDLNKPYDDFMRDAEQVFAMYRDQYQTAHKELDNAIRIKRSHIRSVQEDIKQLLFVTENIRVS